jgi:hypothetical protein
LEGSVKVLQVEGKSCLQLAGLCGVLEALCIVRKPFTASVLTAAQKLWDKGIQNTV